MILLDALLDVVVYPASSPKLGYLSEELFGMLSGFYL